MEKVENKKIKFYIRKTEYSKDISDRMTDSEERVRKFLEDSEEFKRVLHRKEALKNLRK